MPSPPGLAGRRVAPGGEAAEVERGARPRAALLSPATAALLVVAAVGLGLRLHHLGHLSLWLDEGFTWWAVGLPFREVLADVPVHDKHPPLYYLVAKLFTLALGTGEAALRSASVAAGVATIPVVWLAGRTLGGREDGAWVGLAAATLFALAPVQLQYAQEARRFALVTLAASCAIAGALWLATHPAAARRPLLGWGGAGGGRATASGDPRLAWLALIAGLVASAWADNMTVLTVAALGLGGLFWLWRDHRRDRGALANALLAVGLVLLAWSPYLARLVAQTGEVGRGFWLQPPDANTILNTAEFLFSVRFLERPPTSWPLLALAALGLWALWRRGRLSAAVLLASAVVLPFALSLAVSVTLLPVFLARTLLWTTVPFYLALASALLLLPRRALPRAVAVAALAALSLAGVARYYDDFDKEPWRQVVGGIAADWRPDDLLVLVPRFQGRMVEYYTAREGRPLRLFLPSAAGPDAGPAGGEATDAEPGGGPPPFAITDEDVAALRTAAAPAGRVWVLYRDVARFDPDRKVRRLLEAQGRPLLREERVMRKLMWLDLHGPAAAGPGAP